MTSPSRVTAAGIVKEAAFGAGGAPFMQLPFMAFTPTDVVGQAVDTGWRTAPVDNVGMIPATTESKITTNGYVQPDAIGYPLAGVLGDVGFTAGTPNIWTAALLNSGSQQPPSYCITTLDPVGGMQYAGCKFESLRITYDPKQLLAWSATIAGLAGTTTTPTMPNSSSETPFQAWLAAVTIAGLTETRLLSATIDISRPVTAKRNTDLGLAPNLQRTSIAAVSGSLMFLLSSDTYRQDMLNGTGIALDMTFTRGVGASLRSLQLHCSSVKLLTTVRDYSGTYVRLSSTFRAVANTTDVGASGGYSPLKATWKNVVGTGVYA